MLFCYVVVEYCDFFATSAIANSNHSAAPAAGETNSTGGGYGGGLYPGLNQLPASPEASAPAVSELSTPSKRAKVLYDYDAADKSELSLVADEVRRTRFSSR